jgi:hypothetical protein
MSQYLILIYGDEASWDEAGSPEFISQVHKEHAAFQQANTGAVRAGEALHRTGTATSIRKDASGVTVTDGPFAETKEALGGFYLVEAADLDEAISIAKQVPAPFGGVEVRPIRSVDFD